MKYHYDVLTVGNAMIDAFLAIHESALHCRIDKKTCELCVGYGEKINVDRVIFSIGGNAANVAVGLARLGVKATLCAEIGDDELAIKITNGLAKEQIDRICIKLVPQTATSFTVGINFQGERTLFVEHTVRKHDFNFALVDPSWIYLTSLGKDWITPYEKVYSFLEKNNVKLAFNPGSLQFEEWHSNLMNRILKKTDILFVNREEAEKIVFGHALIPPNLDKKHVFHVATKLQTLGVKTVVITDGQHGSYAKGMDGENYHLHIFPHSVVERTGAGDAYASGFLAAVVTGESIPNAMRYGSVNASSVIGKIGAQEGLLKKQEMKKLLENHTDFMPDGL